MFRSSPRYGCASVLVTSFVRGVGTHPHWLSSGKAWLKTQKQNGSIYPWSRTKRAVFDFEKVTVKYNLISEIQWKPDDCELRRLIAKSWRWRWCRCLTLTMDINFPNSNKFLVIDITITISVKFRNQQLQQNNMQILQQINSRCRWTGIARDGTWNFYGTQFLRHSKIISVSSVWLRHERWKEKCVAARYPSCVFDYSKLEFWTQGHEILKRCSRGCKLTFASM